jgi:hypothetical protein
MSAASFQIALQKIISSPKICNLVNKNDFRDLSYLNLSSKEKSRLYHLANQKGIRACYNIYHMNRVTPFFTQLPYSFKMLDKISIATIDEFICKNPIFNIHYKSEIENFGEFLITKINNGYIEIPYLIDILKLELAMNKISYLPEGDSIELITYCDVFEIIYYLEYESMQSINSNTYPRLYLLYLENGSLKIKEQ